MGLFKRISGKNLLKSIGLGVIDSLPVVSSLKSNFEHQNGGFGKIDFPRLIMNIGMVLAILFILYALISGKLSFDEALKLLDALE